MNKPVAPWSGTKGLHKEEKAVKPKMSEKSLKKGSRKVAVRMVEKAKKHSKEDMHEAAKHMKKHGG
jgi:hypothetical protein